MAEHTVYIPMLPLQLKIKSENLFIWHILRRRRMPTFAKETYLESFEEVMFIISLVCFNWMVYYEHTKKLNLTVWASLISLVSVPDLVFYLKSVYSCV